MKRTASLFNQIIDYDNIRLAYLKARRGKTSKNPVKKFSRNLNQNLIDIQKRLKADPLQTLPYHQFKISDPKERTISAVPFADRVLHHAIMNILEPVFEKQFIYHTYACRKNKGTHAAIRVLEQKVHDDLYFIKLDVRKYFESINHEILKNQLCRIIKDKKCLQLLFEIIDSYEKGLPIGNLTSQFFANFYLSCFDHYVLEYLKPYFYIRYMDDMVVLVKSKRDCDKMLKKIIEFMKYRLDLNIKIPVVAKCCYGIPFLGRLIFYKKHVLLNSKKKRKSKKIEFINWLYVNKYISEQKACERICCVMADC